MLTTIALCIVAAFGFWLVLFLLGHVQTTPGSIDVALAFLVGLLIYTFGGGR